jgi:hypothetical protein
MSPYFEIDGDPREGEPKFGIPLPNAIKERKLSRGEKVVLLDSNSIYSEESGASVLVKILSSEKAKVVVETQNGNYKPGSLVDIGKPNAAWLGAAYWQEDSIGRVRRQKTFVTKRKTIFTSGLKRVEWREK